MRDCVKTRAGFDRVLTAVAATFLTVCATSAFSQTDPVRNSAAELAIDAAIPRPEPANLPPPSIGDFKLDTVVPAQVTAKAVEPPPASKPSDVVTAPPSDTNADTSKKDTATTTTVAPPAAAAAAPVAERPKEATKAASNVAPADQPVAEKLRELMGAKSVRYFDRKAERAAVE